MLLGPPGVDQGIRLSASSRIGFGLAQDLKVVRDVLQGLFALLPVLDLLRIGLGLAVEM